MELEQIFAMDTRICRVRRYYDGFVPLSYHWPCIREATDYYRDGIHINITYDAKRSGGCGPAWVGYSQRGGRLCSGSTFMRE